MLGINERSVAAGLLGARDRVQGNRRLTGGFGSVDLDDAAARKATDSEGDVEGEGAGRDHLDGGTVVVTQSHDRALAELFIDLRERHFERLVAIVGDRLCRGCFTGCHDVPFVFRPLRPAGVLAQMPPLSEAP